MKITLNKNTVYTFIICTIFLDAYCFFSIGKRDITVFYIGALILFLVAFLNSKSVLTGIKKNPCAILMPIYFVFNYFILDCDALTTLVIGIMLWLFYVMSYRMVKVDKFEKQINLFQKIMNVLACYGIYQLFAYYFDLPFANLWIEGLMADGFNWGNTITVGGVVLRRANAIFREPSFFSQFIALNMLLYIQKYIEDSTKKKKIEGSILGKLILNGLALICTFSGTGLIMLIGGAVCLLITSNIKKVVLFIKRHIFIVLVLAVLMIVVLFVPNPLSLYLFSRLSEFDSTNTQSISGYLRMVLPYEASLEIIRDVNPMMGLGLGNAMDYVTQDGFPVGASMQPILPRTLAETGIIGGVLLIGFYISAWKKENFVSGSYRALLIGTYLMSFMHGTWSSEVYWLLLGLLNCRLVLSSDRETKVC